MNLGLALQLTNIIRDVAADLQARPHLPAAEDLAASACTEDELRAGRRDAAVRALLAFECERAHGPTIAAPPRSLPPADARSLVAAEIMGGDLLRDPAAHRARRATTCSAAEIRVPRPQRALVAALWLGRCSSPADGLPASRVTRRTSSSSAAALRA